MQTIGPGIELDHFGRRCTLFKGQEGQGKAMEVEKGTGRGMGSYHW